MAEVFLAVAYGASGFEKKVALKTLLPGMIGNATIERLLIEEARLCARLTHRNLVQVHDLGVEDGVYWVRLDWVDGADLETLARQERPPLGLALLIAEELALALEYVHRVTDDAGRPLGLVHRDVSPSNILLSRAGEVKLADFGIAKATMLAGVTRANVRKGKFAYMSPEQASGEPLTAQSDLFALGITVFELLAGRRPFDGDSPVETMDRIREAAPPDVSELPVELGAILRRCMAKRPTDRPESAEALRRSFAVLRAALPSAAPTDLGNWVRQRMA
jgi:eukaryotic-like serine/threonine-protein kinase